MSLVWSLTVELAYEGIPVVHVGVVSDSGGQRFTAGTQEDLENATALPELNQFLQSIGYGSSSPVNPPANLNDYAFRFQSVAAGSVLVLGGNKANGAQVLTNDQTAAMVQLNADSGFTKFMDTISTPGDILVNESTNISFTQTIGTNKIASAVGTPFSGLSASDQVTVIGGVNDNKTFTVSGVELDGARISVSQQVTVAAAGPKVTIIALP